MRAGMKREQERIWNGQQQLDELRESLRVVDVARTVSGCEHILARIEAVRLDEIKARACAGLDAHRHVDHHVSHYIDGAAHALAPQVLRRYLGGAEKQSA